MMNRLIAVLLIVTMLLTACLVSCSKKEPSNADLGQTDGTSTEKPTEMPTEKPTEKPADEPSDEPSDEPTDEPSDEPTDEPTEDQGPYTHTFSYVAAEDYGYMKALYENNCGETKSYWREGAPYALADVEALENSTLKSISIPVHSTLGADNGNFSFTVSIFKNDLATIAASSAVAVYEIKVSALEHGLTENTSDIYKFITVDVSEYNIKVGEGEMIAFSGIDDTILPAYIEKDASNTNSLLNFIKQEIPQMCGFTMYVGNQAFNTQETNCIFYNFTYERTYATSEERDAAANADVEFEKMLEAVKNEYGGKQLSVLGDSISTFEGISTDTSINSTIGSNDVWYKEGNGEAITKAFLHSYEDTYWGTVLEKVGMELCVNNAWSGDSFGHNRVFGRAQQLHRDGGATVNPDLILIYYGINDTWGNTGRATSDLKALIAARGDKSVDEVMDEWFAGVLARAESEGFTSNNFKWDEAYALMLYLVSKKYPNAKMVCVELAQNGSPDYTSSDTRVPEYNELLAYVAEYFDAPIAKQTSFMNETNYHAYTHDVGMLHPNAHGHQRIFEEIIRALYADMQNNK